MNSNTAGTGAGADAREGAVSVDCVGSALAALAVVVDVVAADIAVAVAVVVVAAAAADAADDDVWWVVYDGEVAVVAFVAPSSALNRRRCR